MKLLMICGLVCFVADIQGYSPLIVHDLAKGDPGSVSDTEDPRNSKKIVFFNNRAYDMSDEDHRAMWNMYMKKAYVPEDINLNLNDKIIHTDPNLKTRVSDLDADLVVEEPTNYLPLMKTSRFVADPDKFHLIEDVEDSVEEPESYPSVNANTVLVEEKTPTTTSSTSQINDSNPIVYYEQSQSSLVEYVMNELVYNVGSLFTREIFDDIGSVLSYLWNSFVFSVQGAARRFMELRSI